MAIVAKHVQAGTGRAEQHGVTRLRLRKAPKHGVLQTVVALHGHPSLRHDVANDVGVAANQRDGACVALQGFAQGQKVLALAITPQDHDQARWRFVGTQAQQSRHSGTHVGALAVIKGIHVAHRADPLHTVGFTAVLTQAVQHGRQGAADAGGQGQGSQRIGGVVAAPHQQGVGGHQALQQQGFKLASFQLHGDIERNRPHQPGHVVLSDHAPVTRALRRRQTKPLHDAGRYGRLPSRCFADDGWGHRGQHGGVIGVDNHGAAASPHARFGCAVPGHVAMPVEVVLGDVEQRCGVGRKRRRVLQLKARQLQHPDLRPLRFV